MQMSQSSLRELLTDCWSNVNQDIDGVFFGCPLRTDRDVNPVLIINPLTPASNCPWPTPNFRAFFGIFQKEQKHKNKPYVQ